MLSIQKVMTVMKVKTRTLHRNLLLLANDLPVEFLPQPTRPTSRPSRRQGNPRVRASDVRDQTASAETSDSDDEPAGGYWLRIPANWAEPRTTATPERPAVSQRKQMPVLETHALSEKMPSQTTRKPLRAHDEPAQRQSAKKTQYRNGNGRELVGVHGDGKIQIEAQTLPETDSVALGDETQTKDQCERGHSLSKRRRTTSRQPLTYLSLTRSESCLNRHALRSRYKTLRLTPLSN